MSNKDDALRSSILMLGTLLKEPYIKDTWPECETVMVACVEALREEPPRPIGIVMENIYPASVRVGLYTLEELPLGTKVYGKPA
jgi:hypothetical protein